MGRLRRGAGDQHTRAIWCDVCPFPMGISSLAGRGKAGITRVDDWCAITFMHCVQLTLNRSRDRMAEAVWKVE